MSTLNGSKPSAVPGPYLLKIKVFTYTQKSVDRGGDGDVGGGGGSSGGYDSSSSNSNSSSMSLTSSAR
ncbi:hypothetical protein M0804_001982 [Polistes exclamans]|nr:hypothetical protein M0804_001982 [Polistes exclamans]